MSREARVVEKRLPWVLVVDDNEANRYAVGRTLRAAGFETSEASNGRQAIELARTQPDVIVLDVNLPDMNGFDVVRELRKYSETALIPILHLSASYMRNEDRVHGLDNGANAYLTHPIEPSVFVATIRSLLRVRRLEEERESASAEWRATFDAISDLVCVVDHLGAVTRANRAAMDVLGRDASGVHGKKWVAMLETAYPGIDVASISATVARRERTAVEQRSGDRWLRIAVDPLTSGASYDGSVVAVVTDITAEKTIEAERQTLLAEAQYARDMAESANRAKSEFLATMSHEIRTPINAILGYTQILDMGIAGAVEPEQRLQLDRIRRSASHLITLVNELLDLAKIESGEMRVDSRQVIVDDVVEDALAIARPQALARGITIDVAESAPHRLSFNGDPGRVRQILINLLSNAVKFSGAGTRIALSSGLGDSAVAPRHDLRFAAIRIADSGVGVNPERRDEIFEPFVQGESGTTRTWGGSGVGLAISRRLARLMGGDVTVESTAGNGAVFTLWLPSTEDQSLIATTESPVPRRSAPFDPTILSQLGRLLASEPLTLATSLALRVRTDRRFPPAIGLSDLAVIDHFPAYVTTLGLSLITIADVGIEAAASLHDGNVIRNEIVALHGAQRRRLGWTEEQLALEYDLMCEEIESLLRGRAGSAAAHVDGALELIERLLDQSRVVSLRGYREARIGDE